MAPVLMIPQFLLPRGISPNTLRYAAATIGHTGSYARLSMSASQGCHFFSSSPSWKAKSEKDKQHVLAQPDKFRPPSHPARRVVQTRDGKIVGAATPYNYPGPSLSTKELEERKTKQYPNMFPPEGTVLHKFLTTQWIHAWIAMGVLISLAVFSFTTNFKRTSPFVDLLPPWSALLTHPIGTISQALSVFKMHVQHTSVMTREQRHRRNQDVEKRRQYRIAHGLEEPDEADVKKDSSLSAASIAQDDQSPIAPDADQPQQTDSKEGRGDREQVEGPKRPVRKWLGIW
ncbi:hypothetical protein Egran_03880 [Elaphomyces granulatus]|uniref:Uncharacterized protein n=1 Tax=Elaphomyces granulatus TaxID=519963 RepID=A0A232LWA7_9EURO|nr:hypothetical protein Egran_03880 [Elaphomyces granulatus]